MRLARNLVLALGAALAIAAAPNWNATVAVTPAGAHVLGNPAARTKLTEYISYTCPHCAHFEKESGDALRIYLVRRGKLSIEVRNLVRDPVDMTAAMLTNCGPPAKFMLNHTLFLHSQDRWIAAANTASEVQQKRWYSGDSATRFRAIAQDFGFYQMMETRGYNRIAVDRCLGDAAMAKRLADQTAESSKLGVTGTPSFLLDGVLLAGTHDWETLQAQLKARIK